MWPIKMHSNKPALGTDSRRKASISTEIELILHVTTLTSSGAFAAESTTVFVYILQAVPDVTATEGRRLQMASTLASSLNSQELEAFLGRNKW
jgi:hypothetical protein